MTPDEFADRIAGQHDMATTAQWALYPVFTEAFGGSGAEHHRQASTLWLACVNYWKRPDGMYYRRAVIDAVTPLLPTPPDDEGTDE